MMDNRYREELDRIRLTEESKGALAAALAARRSAPERQSRRRAHRWSRTAVAAAALTAALVLSVGAAVTVSPVVRNYFGDSAGYRQSAAELGQSVTKNGWTMTLTDCLADDYTLYLGVTLTAPEGTVLDNPDGYFFADWRPPCFPELEWGGGGTYRQLDDGDPADNQLSFLFRSCYLPFGVELDGQIMEVKLGGLCHNAGWTEGSETYSYEKITDCGETWTIRAALNTPKRVIRLEPDLPVHTLDVDATITEVQVSPLSVYVHIEGDSLLGHHSWVPEGEDGSPACIEHQEVVLRTKDGAEIPMTGGMSCSGCGGGEPGEPGPGELILMRRPDTPLDVDNLASISICGVEIPLT